VRIVASVPRGPIGVLDGARGWPSGYVPRISPLAQPTSPAPRLALRINEPTACQNNPNASPQEPAPDSTVRNCTRTREPGQQASITTTPHASLLQSST
jgi:hypothetical protein